MTPSPSKSPSKGTTSLAGTVATRPCDPPAVAAAESVIEVELLMALDRRPGRDARAGDVVADGQPAGGADAGHDRRSGGQHAGEGRRGGVEDAAGPNQGAAEPAGVWTSHWHLVARRVAGEQRPGRRRGRRCSRPRSRRSRRPRELLATGDVADQVDHLDVERGLAVGQGVGELDREVVAPVCESVLVVDEAVAVAWTAGWPLTNSSTVLPGAVVPMNTGVRSLVTLSPTIPVSLGRVEAEVVHRDRDGVVDLEARWCCCWSNRRCWGC